MVIFLRYFVTVIKNLTWDPRREKSKILRMMGMRKEEPKITNMQNPEEKLI
jgi:hypothetical protein